MKSNVRANKEDGSGLLLYKVTLNVAIQAHSPGFADCMRAMVSPFSKIRPRGFEVCFEESTSTAASRTRFMYSSKPTMRPSMQTLALSYSQIRIRVRCTVHGVGMIYGYRDALTVCATHVLKETEDQVNRLSHDLEQILFELMALSCLTDDSAGTFLTRIFAAMADMI